MKLNRLFAGALACVTAACALAGAIEAKASPYVVTLEQFGSDVVATGSGNIDTTGLTYDTGPYGPNSQLQPWSATILTGATAGDRYYIYASTGPTSFGSGPTISASFGTATGGLVGVSASGAALDVYVPYRYASETAVSDSATYLNATFASLGVTPGTYVWTWGSGADQRFTLEIGATATPLPAALPLFATGLGALGLLGWRRKRKAQAAA